MDIEYWNGDAWVPAVEGASLGDISKVFTFDEFESNKVRLKINEAWKYAYYGYIGIDAFRLFNLNNRQESFGSGNLCCTEMCGQWRSR